MPPGPDFKFEWAYIEWWDSTQSKWRTVWHNFTKKQWEEDGAFKAYIIVDPNAVVYYGFKIKNKGDSKGTCRHWLVDTVNNRTLKILTTPDLAPGGIWEEQLEKWTADKYMAVKMQACYYANGRDYIHHETDELVVKIRTKEEIETDLECYDESCEKGEWVTLRATLKEKDTGKSIPGMLVKFYVDGTWKGEDTTDGNGDASISTRCDWSPGTHTIKAVFGGYENLYKYKSSSCTASLQVTAPPCKVETDKDKYYQSDTVTISYENAPAGSTLSIGKYPTGTPGRSWTVSGSGSKTYTIPSDAPTGTWYVYLSGTGCSKTKYITVSSKPQPEPCAVETDKTTYRIGETITISYENAPAGSTLILYDPDGVKKTSWSVEGTSKKTYKLPSGAKTGVWTIQLYDTGCFEALSITVIEECNRGVIIKVKEVPDEGLQVVYLHPGLAGCINWQYARDKEVTPGNPEAVFYDIRDDLLPVGGDKACFRVLNKDGDVMSETGEINIPDKGCSGPITMHGWLGCKYRTRITTDPAYPAPGKSFMLKATLIENPRTPAGKDLEIEFFKLVDNKEVPLDKNMTNEHGVAVLSHTEPEAGRYKYFARYTGADTYAEIKTVTVREPTCPIDISQYEKMCPIFTATQGTIVFTKLDTLRWFRDNHMPKTLVKVYYWLTPVTGRIAKYSRIARMIIKGLTEISIKAIERRYNLKWEA